MSRPSSQLDLGDTERIGIETSGGVLAAIAAGDGIPALLVPGYTGSKEDFAPLLGPLAAAGFRAVAIDLPGQFQSPGPADPAAYRPDALAASVVEAAATLGPPVHLLGHSFGGLVARAAVIADADSFASLTLMCSGPAALSGPRGQLIAHLEPVLAASGLAAVYAAAEAVYRGQPGYIAPPPALAEFLRTRFVAGVPAMLQGMGTALREEPDRVAELAASGVRTLVLYGEDDDAWPPAEQDAMATRLGAARAVVTSAAHSPAVENPAATAAALVRFWHA